MADEIFYDILSELLLNSKLQNKIIRLEQQVLKLKKIALQKQF